MSKMWEEINADEKAEDRRSSQHAKQIGSRFSGD